jgi:hypothetical protein
MVCTQFHIIWISMGLHPSLMYVAPSGLGVMENQKTNPQITPAPKANAIKINKTATVI